FASVVIPVPIFRAVTVASPTAPPPASVITPVIAAVWPKALLPKNMAAANRTDSKRRIACLPRAFVILANRPAAQSLPQCRRRFRVTLQAQSPDIGKIAFTAALGDGRDVVGVPQARATQALQAPVAQQP